MRKRNKPFDSFAKAAAAMLLAGVLLTSCDGGGEPEAPASPPAQEMPAPSQKPEEKPAESSSTASSVPASSSAASEATGSSEMVSEPEGTSKEQWNYEVTGKNTATLTGVTESDAGMKNGTLTIPAVYKGYQITAIGKQAFYQRDDITAVVIPDGVETIGDEAFMWCRNLQKVSFGDNIRKIGTDAFQYCTLKSLVLPKNLEEIGGWAFCSAGLNGNLVLPASLKNIGSGAFANTGITMVRFEASVNTMGSGVFASTKLEKVVLPEGMERIEKQTFNNCEKLTSIYVPGSVRSVGEDAFLTLQGNTLQEVYYGGTKDQWNCITVAQSGNDVWKNANLHLLASVEAFESAARPTERPAEKSYWITDGEILMGYSTDGPTLTGTVTLPTGGDRQLNYSSGGDYVTQTRLVSVGNSTGSTSLFENCLGVTEFVIPSSYTSIGDGAFYGLNLKRVNIPKNVTSVGALAYYGNDQMLELTIQGDVTLGMGAFDACYELKKVTFNGSVWTIPSLGFANCTSLESICLPKNLRVIEENGFEGCYNLKSIVMPRTVKTIGQGAFSMCNQLTEIYYEGSEEDWDKIVISKENDTLTRLKDWGKIHFNSKMAS